MWRLDSASTLGQYEDILHEAEGALERDRNWLVPLGLGHVVKGVALSMLDRLDAATSVFTDALSTLKESGCVVYLPYYFQATAMHNITNGNTSAAHEDVSEMRRLANEYGMPLLAIDSYLVQAQIYLAAGDSENVRKLLQTANKDIQERHYFLRTTDLEVLEVQAGLLDGLPISSLPISSGRSLRQISEKIKQTGRGSLEKRWNESVRQVNKKCRL